MRECDVAIVVQLDLEFVGNGFTRFDKSGPGGGEFILVDTLRRFLAPVGVHFQNGFNDNGFSFIFSAAEEFNNQSLLIVCGKFLLKTGELRVEGARASPDLDRVTLVWIKEGVLRLVLSDLLSGGVEAEDAGQMGVTHENQADIGGEKRGRRCFRGGDVVPVLRFGGFRVPAGNVVELQRGESRSSTGGRGYSFFDRRPSDEWLLLRERHDLEFFL